MTNRLRSTVASPTRGSYDTLIAEAVAAFSQDIAYVIEIAESARTISSKKQRKTQPKV